MAQKLVNAQIEKRYLNLLNRVKTDPFYQVDLTNRVNCYTCTVCKKITKTKDIDAGTTPFMIPCPVCKQAAKSSFYKDIAPEQEPEFEWFRPTIAEVLKNKKNPHLLDHFLSGGLDYRKISNNLKVVK